MRGGVAVGGKGNSYEKLLAVLPVLGMATLALLLTLTTPLLGADPVSAPVQPPATAEEARLQERYPAYRGVGPGYVHAGEEAVERWMDQKWGLRIHWGLYTLNDDPKSNESWVIRDRIHDKEWQRRYYAAYTRFNPTAFDANEWMRVIRRGGMKYFSFTTKHHEGFCLWPTKTLQRGFREQPDGTFVEVVDTYSVAETPFRRDIVGELVQAGRTAGLGVSLYYSHIDWHDWDFGWDKLNFWHDGKFLSRADDPARWDAFIRKEREQVTELLTNYGPIDTLCLDMNWLPEAKQDAYGVAKLARELQPKIMLRNRGIGAYGDYETPEGEIPEDPNQVERPWQVIYPCGKGFSYRSNDVYGTKDWVLESLIDIVAKGGNFQIGFGPDPLGRWPQEMHDRLAYVGDWLQVNGEAIYATRPYLRYHEGAGVRFTRSKDQGTVYAILLSWPGPVFTSRMLKPRPGSEIRVLGHPHPLPWRQVGDAVEVTLPAGWEDEARRPCRQAIVLKTVSRPWAEFQADLPRLEALPKQKKRKDREPSVKPSAKEAAGAE